MIRRTERQIYSYDLTVNVRAEHAIPPGLQQIALAWETMFRMGLCSHERERGTVVYRIGDISIDARRQVLSMLIRRCDTNAANAVYSHRHTGTPRVAEKEPDEGADRAAHVVISLVAQTGKPNVYLCHLEGMPGLSHSFVRATLNAVLKRAIAEEQVAFTYPHPAGARNREGNPRVIPFQPTIELVGHPSEQLVNDLEQGRINEVILVDHRPDQQVGGNPFVREREKQLRVFVDDNMPRNQRAAHLLAALATRRDDYQTAKVRFTDPVGQNRSVDYDLDTGAFEQQRYVRSYLVQGIRPAMDESSVALAPFLTAQMQARIVAERT